MIKCGAAKGIPDRSNYGELDKLTPGELLDLVVQEHDARVRGKHYDLRFGDRDRGLFSFATQYDPLTSANEGYKTTLYQQPLHEYDYKDFEGEIPEGYGAGTVKKHLEDKILIGHKSPRAMSLVTAGKYPQRYALVNTGKDREPILTRMNMPEVHKAQKAKYVNISPEEIEAKIQDLKDAVVQAKIDGALHFLQMTNGKPEILSHRTSRVTGKPIVHTERVFGGIPHLDLPDEFKDAVLKAEIYAEREGKALHPTELNSLLNSSLAKSLQRQREEGINLRIAPFDIEGRDEPYSQRYARMQRFVDALPPELKDKFVLPKNYTDKEEILELIRQIREGEHPLTDEGIVIHPESGPPMRMKNVEEQDVYVRDVFPGQGKFEGHPGGFQYSLTPDGPIVGKVGTGFDDELRKSLKDYIGRVARVKSRGSHESGALRDPRLMAFHESYPHKQASEIGPRKLYSWVDRAALDSVRERGLMSSEAILNDEAVLNAMAAVRGVEPEVLKQEIQNGLNSWKHYAYQGPSLMFKQPHEGFTPHENHPLNTRDLVPLEVDLDALLADIPDTQFHGMELEPYDEARSEALGDDYADVRHRDLSEEELNNLLAATAEDLWGRYNDTEGKGLYAPDVPHVSVITPSRKIDPKYIKFPEMNKQAANYTISGDKTQGIGLRKTYHQLLDELGHNGLAVNNPHTNEVELAIDAPNPDEVLAELARRIKERKDADIAFNRAEQDVPMEEVIVPNDKLEELRNLHYQAYLNSELYDPEDSAIIPPDEHRQAIIDRYLLEDHGEHLKGVVPERAKRQLMGEEMPYSWMEKAKQASEEENKFDWKEIDQPSDPDHGFTPDLSGEDMQEPYEAIYGKMGPQLASMGSWPDEWRDTQDPMGWLEWYKNYADGRRGETDEHQIKRWKSFKARHGAQFKKNPTPRRAFALRNWAIDPLKLIDDPEQRKELEAAMADYKAKEEAKWREKHASLDINELQAVATFLNKEHDAKLPINVSVPELEQYILDFINGAGADSAPYIMQAGVEGLKNVQQDMKNYHE